MPPDDFVFERDELAISDFGLASIDVWSENDGIGMFNIYNH